jgi:hypothetical protein
VLGGDERGPGGSRLHGATDLVTSGRNKAATAHRCCPVLESPISDSALERLLDHPRPQNPGRTNNPPPLAAQPSPTQPKKGSPNERGLLSGVGCQCCSCSFPFAGKSSPLASQQQTLHDQGICKRIPSRLVSCFTSAAFQPHLLHLLLSPPSSLNWKRSW